MPAEGGPDMDVLVTKFISTFTEDTESPYVIAARTVDLVKSLVECNTWSNADTQLTNVKGLCSKLEENFRSSPHDDSSIS